MTLRRGRGDQMSIQVPIKADEEGFIGRECPEKKCLGYFKIQPGTGMTGDNLPCYCPYCGHKDPHDHFWTQEQLAYAKSIALREIGDYFHRELKKIEFDIKPRGGFGIGVSMKVKQGAREPIRHYREKTLETIVVCGECTLRYAVYGVFAFCPDCGLHNSQQILTKNCELARKQIELAASVEDADLKRHLLEDALENAVSAFDGFGREACRVHAAKTTNQAKAEAISFQNLTFAASNVQKVFGIDLPAGVDPDEWAFAVRCFQKRHLLAHTMGVIDEKYLAATSDPTAVAGRRVQVVADEVHQLLEVVQKLGEHLVTRLREVPEHRGPNN